MNKKVFIFDLDGTLVNTLSDIAFSINKMLMTYDFENHSEDAVRKMIGKGARNLVTNALPESKRDDSFVDEALDRYRKIYEKNLVVKTHTYDGIPGVLAQLKKQGVRMAVLSNKDDGHVKYTVDALMPGMFQSVNGFSPLFPHKPSPEAVFDIMKRMNAKPDETAFIGDSAVDIQTARNAGIMAVGVTWGFDSGESFEKFTPDVKIDKPIQLLEI